MGTKLDRDALGALVKNRRNAVGLSTRKAAELTPPTAEGRSTVSVSTWNQVETGRLNTTLDVLDAIGEVLGCRWELALVPDGPRMDDTRRELLDRLRTLVDRLPDRDVRQLSRELEFYEAELRGVQNHKKT